MSEIHEKCGFVSSDEAREIARRYNASHWQRRDMGECARYSIPARPSHDDDLRLGAYIDRVKRLEKAVRDLLEIAEDSNMNPHIDLEALRKELAGAA